MRGWKRRETAFGKSKWLLDCLFCPNLDKRTKFDKEIELAEDGNHHSAIRRATKDIELHDMTT